MFYLNKISYAVIFFATTALSAPRRPRLTLAENFMPQYFFRDINGNPDTYSFGYDISDPKTGNIQYRNEERYPNGTVVGSYGFVDSAGTSQTYKYVADKNGYRVMNDLPNKNHASYETHSPLTYPLPDSEESTITWSRPKKPNNKNDKTEEIGSKNEYVDKTVPGSIRYRIPY